jgi:hypothetical protein
MKDKKQPAPANDSLKLLKAEIEKISDPDAQTIAQCMVVVLSALEVGADIGSLVKRTGYSKDFVEGISRRMRAAGLWIGELVDDREWREKDEELMSDVFRHALVVKGTLLRELTENGGCIYFDSETREIRGEWCPPAMRVNLA